jgi:thiopurine S-methyltransferase
MDPDLWHQRWNNNRIGFHQRGVNALMMAHFGALNLKPGSTVFVPLCGKSHDIGWLLAQGYRVIGSELSALAIDQLFEDLDLEPDISDIGTLKLYRGPKLDVFVGDIFELTAELLGRIDGVYDRAALVALPADMRADYARHVHTITADAPQFLLCFDYDQSVMEGPPFSVDKAEVERVYGHHYTLSLIEKADVVGGLKGVCPAIETAWLLL